ncbi:hypothetical protein M2396_002613 [Pseudomonas sp. BIGb0278]|nr:hypothetical protein [Pseudomonas sp. BIGb0278]MCS4284317.1 hypothetical protein [Pseudomonas sp. BIGb0278]
MTQIQFKPEPQTAGIKKTTRQHLVVFYGLVAVAANGYRAAKA